MQYLVFLILFCLSCIPSNNGAVTSEYKKYLCEVTYPIAVSPDASFSDTELGYVELAIETWNIAASAEVFHLAPQSLQNSNNLSGIEINHRVLNGREVGIWYYRVFVTNNKVVWRSVISLDTSEMDTQEVYPNTVVHELGHALGLYHDTYDPGSIMYPNVFISGQKIRKSHLDHVASLIHSKQCN